MDRPWSSARKVEPPRIAGRVPPHDLDAEAAVLSAILLSRDAFDRVVDILKWDHFYSGPNGMIYEAAQSLASAGSPIDVVAVASWLRDRERLAKVGGPAYLAQLSDATPSIGNVAAHAQVVYDKWRVRQLIAACQRIAAEGYGDIGDASEWIDQAEASVHAIASESAATEVTPTMRETLHDVFSRLQDEGDDGGIYTGLRDLDRLMGPMKPGNLVVIGAHSGIGKTSIGVQMLINVASSADRDGCAMGGQVFSHEMTRHELAERTLFSKARVDSSKVANKRSITPDEWNRIAEAAREMPLDNIWFDDRPGLTPLQIRAKARRVQSEADRVGAPLKIILVDYLQLLDGTTGGKKQAERREREIAYCSQKLKELAKELGVVVVLLAQLNDDSRREKRHPRKEDLRECKAVAQDADKVILLHNPAAMERAMARRRGEEVERPLEAEFVDIILDKNRGGKTGKVGALFFPTYVLFADPTEDDYERYDRGQE